MEYMVEPPPPGADARREFKYPYLACEIFCCEIDAVFQTLVDDDCALFARVMAFLDGPKKRPPEDSSASADSPDASAPEESSSSAEMVEDSEDPSSRSSSKAPTKLQSSALALDPMLATYFSKTAGCVISRRRQDATRFFQTNPAYLDKLVDRVGTLAVAEVLLRLVGADDPGVMALHGMMMSVGAGAGDSSAWLAETNLLDRLLDAVGDEDHSEAATAADGEAADDEAAAEDSSSRHANAAEVLVGVARGAPSALAAKLADVESMRKLLRRGTGVASRGGGGAATAAASGMNNTYARGAPAESSVGGGALNESDADSGGAAGVSVGIAPGTPTTAHDGAKASPLVNVLDIAISVLDAKRAAGPAGGNSVQMFLAAHEDAAGVAASEPPGASGAPDGAVEACLDALDALSARLTVVGDGAAQRTTWGALTPPLGLVRVKIADLVATLVATKRDAVAEAVIATGALASCADLFRRYPFNNFLHHHVASAIESALEWGHPALLRHLFAPRAPESPEGAGKGGVDVVGLVADAPEVVDTARGPARAGNVGHRTRLANRLAEMAERHERRVAEGGAGDAEEEEEEETEDAESRRAADAFARDALAADERWAPYASGALKARNDVENVHRWACGRPAGMDDGGGDGSGGEDDHDFDLGLGGFGRDAYRRYAGGDLDEEDELEEEEEEEEEEDAFGEEDAGALAETDRDAFGGGGLVHDGGSSGGATVAGLFGGVEDAGARLASLTFSNPSPKEDEDPEEDEEEEEEEDEALLVPGGDAREGGAGYVGFASARAAMAAMEGGDSDDSDDAVLTGEPEEHFEDDDEDDADAEARDAAEQSSFEVGSNASGKEAAAAESTPPPAATSSAPSPPRSPGRSPEELLRSPARDLAAPEPTRTDPDELSSEFGSARFWGSGIDASLVPDDV